MIQKIKKQLLYLSGINPVIKKTIKCRAVWYGNKYGGFYVHPDILNENPIVYSFGIGEPIKRISDIVKELNHRVIDVLKMDVEGFDYECIPDILKLKVDIRQMVIEFHHRFLKDGKRKTQETIKILSNHGFEVFAVSDSSQEISFIRKDLIKSH